MKTYKCLVCGLVFNVADGEEAVCPKCRAKGDKLVEVKTSKYAGTKTEANLQAAFAGESQARNKYTYFASVAKKEGFEQISAIFQKTAQRKRALSRSRLSSRRQLTTRRSTQRCGSRSWPRASFMPVCCARPTYAMDLIRLAGMSWPSA